MSQALTNSRVRPALLDQTILRDFPELAPAAKALAVAGSAAGGYCCGSSRESKEVEALALAMQVLSVVSETRLVAFLRRIGMRGDVKVYRLSGDKKTRDVIACGP